MSASSNPGANVYTQGSGSAPLAALGIVPIISPNAPASTNIQGPSGPFKLGQLWIDTTAPEAYILVGLSASRGTITATWESFTALPNPANFTGAVNFEGTSVVNFLSGSTVDFDAGSSVTFNTLPIFAAGLTSQNGLTVLSGTANFDSGVNFSSAANVSVNSGGAWSFGNIPSFNDGLDIAGSGDLNISGALSRILINNAAPSTNIIGLASLSGGTVIVNTTAVTTSSSIFVTTNEIAGTQGILSVPQSSIIAGVSFVINSSEGADASSVNYLIIN